AAEFDRAPVRFSWAIAHLALLGPFVYLSARIYAGSTPAATFTVLAVAWHTCALAAVLTLFAALAPFTVWRNAIRQTQGLPFYAILPAAAAVAAIKASQMLWVPAAEVTFHLVRVMLHPILPALHSDPASRILGTQRFAVQIAERCSGLEGIGLLLAFCAGWLWLFRRDYYFPRALLIVPVGVLVIFLLNAVRIAAIVLIGNAGYERVAILGFHSQAGWIAFNLTAFGIAVVAQRTPWVSRVAHRDRAVRRSGAARGTPGPQNPAAGGNPTAAYLMPLLAIVAAGMISHALSAGFEFLYPLRLVAALAALWIYRRSYRDADLRFTWRGPAVGILMFGLWVAAAALLIRPESAPAALAGLPEPLRAVWISCRVIGAVAAVPLAEELAFRGYLLRRLVSPRFETVRFPAARWPALAVSALAFGLMHGVLWLPGIAAGLAYGALAIRTDKLGESVAAHATTNALLAAYVLMFDRWQLW
ncbi:MAG TPA: exosortase E/protease, VPEID-CTERM system, partial [Steroidobacteraceae bacterium]|nr:exosortase E/protease, VPEID-CTERM system [Steroidobacteraceae bacterium]